MDIKLRKAKQHEDYTSCDILIGDDFKVRASIQQMLDNYSNKEKDIQNVNMVIISGILYGPKGGTPKKVLLIELYNDVKCILHQYKTFKVFVTQGTKADLEEAHKFNISLNQYGKLNLMSYRLGCLTITNFIRLSNGRIQKCIDMEQLRLERNIKREVYTTVQIIK